MRYEFCNFMRNGIGKQRLLNSPFCLLGLLDRPMMLREKEELVRNADCAKPLRALTQVHWKRLERRLEAAGLLLHAAEERYHWDCHPLIRDYFGQHFQDTQPDLFRQAQRVLFDYYQTVPSKPRPDTLEELEPLYRAVVHGCLAGEYQKALEKVYWERILHRQAITERSFLEYFSTQRLGAYSQELTALAAFFPHDWSQPVQHGLSEANQAWLLAQASFGLMSVGRLKEAVEPRGASLRMAVKQQD
jgi:hypothetical protein